MENSKFINGCDKQAIAALEYLARYDRPSGGQQEFNAEHLYQIADELKRSLKNINSVEGELTLQEFSNLVGGTSGETRKVSVSQTPLGLRINLPLKKKTPQESPDLYLEATPDGYQILVHANEDEEPFSVTEIQDSGEHEVSFREENLPATAH